GPGAVWVQLKITFPILNCVWVEIKLFVDDRAIVIGLRKRSIKLNCLAETLGGNVIVVGAIFGAGAFEVRRAEIEERLGARARRSLRIDVERELQRKDRIRVVIIEQFGAAFGAKPSSVVRFLLQMLLDCSVALLQIGRRLGRATIQTQLGKGRVGNSQ